VEPDAEVRALFTLLVERLGFEAVLPGADPTSPATVDALLLEPAAERGLETAEALRARRPGLPIVCASIYPESREVRALEPTAFLVKPFPLARLERALEFAVGTAERLSA
jgi:CheY-like chemotaxis protein